MDKHEHVMQGYNTKYCVYCHKNEGELSETEILDLRWKEKHGE